MYTSEKYSHMVDRDKLGLVLVCLRTSRYESRLPEKVRVIGPIMARLTSSSAEYQRKYYTPLVYLPCIGRENR